MKEQWKTIYINGEPTQYEVSNFGRVKSLKCNREKILKQSPNSTNGGYVIIHLYHKSKLHAKTCHRLVAEFFLDNFDESLQVNHKDFNPQNNIQTNLEMVTHQENQNHKKLASRKSNLKKGYSLTEEQVRDIRKKELKLREYADKYNIKLRLAINVAYYQTYKWVK
jgi:hypothetical protein